MQAQPNPDGGVHARWRPPLLDAPSETEAEAPGPSEAELLAQRIAELEAEVAALRADVARAREAAAAEGRAQGYDEGRAAGEAAARDAAAAQRADIETQWRTLAAHLQARAQSLDNTLERAVHDFVVDFAATVLRTELAINGAPLARMLEEALAGVRGDLAVIRVHVHPSDAALLGDVGVIVQPDDTLQRGALRVETPHGEVEASVAARIEAAVAHLRAVPA